jgi:hypothetical protein
LQSTIMANDWRLMAKIYWLRALQRRRLVWLHAAAGLPLVGWAAAFCFARKRELGSRTPKGCGILLLSGLGPEGT